MELIKLTIDNKSVIVKEGTTILEAAAMVGINIPTLCHLDLPDIKFVNRSASCRICVVEVEGRRNLAPACSTKCTNGMVVNTHTMRCMNARRTNLELILSDHPKDCLICSKSGNCELQDLAQHLGIREIPYQGEESTFKEDTSPAIIREMDKCIMCRRCETMCNEVQTVGVLSAINRGFESVVAPAFEMNLDHSECTYCGQCVAVCPTGALHEHDNTNKVMEALVDPDKTVVAQTAPAIRAALGEEFGMQPGTAVTGKMVSALKKLEFDYVFDTDFGADLTIMEEGAELLNRLTKYLEGDTSVQMPMLTSCCPAWVKFFEHHFPELKNVPSSAKSPQQMFGSVAKSYLADRLGVKRENLVVVSVMPCLAKKYESSREEFAVNGDPDVNVSISTRELAGLIKKANIEFDSLEDMDFDKPMGESTGAGVMFGTTGGVIEAAVRTAYDQYTGSDLEEVEFKQLRGIEGIRSAKVDFNGTQLNIGIAHGLGNARQLLEEIKSGKSEYHAIEIMACPGGCIGGGGQPYHHGDLEILKSRQKAIYQEDTNKELKKSYQNPAIQKLYKEYLGKPMGENAHKLLHTQYFDRKQEVFVKE